MTRTTLRNSVSALLLSLAFALIPSTEAQAMPPGVTEPAASWLSRATLRGLVIAAWHHLFADKTTTAASPPGWDGSSWEPLGDD